MNRRARFYRLTAEGRKHLQAEANRLRYLGRPGPFEREMDEEIRGHIEARAAELEQAGAPPAEARGRRAWSFGSVPQVRPKKSCSGASTEGQSCPSQKIRKPKPRSASTWPGTVSQTRRTTPGPAMSASTTVSPGRITLEGAPWRPSLARPPLPAAARATPAVPIV